jgi:hypothetical protein
MKRHNKLSRQQQEQFTSRQQTASQGAQEFANTDEMLRFDAAQTLVPPDVAHRLRKSLGDKAAKRSWWQKLTGL